MNLEEILALLPPTWKNLLTAKQPDFNSCGVDGAERLLLNAEDGFHDNHASSAPHPPDWFSLIDSLMRTRGDTAKKIYPGNSSGMCPIENVIIFFQLPIHLQRTLLGIFAHHATEIPLPLLQKLARHLQDSKMVDHWCQFHLHVIQSHIATHFPNKESQRSKVVPTAAAFVSQRSKKLLDDVCQSIIATDSDENSHGIARERVLDKSVLFDGMRCFIDSFNHAQILHENTEHRFPSTSANILHTIEPLATTTSSDRHPHKRESEVPFDPVHTCMKEKRPRMNTDVGLSLAINDVLVQPPPLLNIQELDEIRAGAELTEGVCRDQVIDTAGGNHLETGTEVENEVSKTENLQRDTTDESQEPAEDEVSYIDSLGADIKMQLDQLKVCWHGEGTIAQTDQCTGVIKVMASCAPSQLSKICAYISVSSIPTMSLPSVCQCIVPLASQFSYTAAVCLAEQIFLQKITSLDQNAPRVLTTSLSEFTRTFPKPAIEGVLTPSLVSQGSLVVKFDLVAKVARDALSSDHKAQLLRTVLVHPDFTWSDPSTSFVQSLIDSKLEVDSSLLMLLITSLDQNATSQAKCKKFAKLLLALINKYCKQITPDHMTQLRRAVEVNQTFLKKACQTALKKIPS